MASPRVGRAAAVTLPIILAIILTLFGIGYAITVVLGLPRSLGLPVVARGLGGVAVMLGLGAAAWMFRLRGAANVIVSTYVTFTKIFRRTPVAERSERTELLVVGGPQKYVRHPLYAGIVLMTFGWAILSSSTFVLVATVVVFAWFRFLLIPFEEKELNALFGDQYRKYCDATPAMVPFTKRKKRPPAVTLE